jgi:hypothetical protein
LYSEAISAVGVFSWQEVQGNAQEHTHRGRLSHNSGAGGWSDVGEQVSGIICRSRASLCICLGFGIRQDAGRSLMSNR